VKRGDIVTVATGKPRPAVVVQSDHLLPYPMIVIVPFTSEIDARPPPFTRIGVDPSSINLLRSVFADHGGSHHRRSGCWGFVRPADGSRMTR
jgi:mRNA-degrading endonuclease toxin of MazEF toxin-antitoxin module